MNCNNTQETHLFVLSFTVGGESGLALVAASNATQAFQILSNSGSRFCEKYNLIQTRDIGMVCDCHYGLLMESFVNAIQAFEAIMAAANKLIGPKGDRGEKGEAGDLTYIMFSLDSEGNLVYDWAEADDVADFALDRNGNLCVIM